MLDLRKDKILGQFCRDNYKTIDGVPHFQVSYKLHDYHIFSGKAEIIEIKSDNLSSKAGNNKNKPYHQ